MLPAYLQIHDQIKKEIDEEVWQIGQRLPSERDLAETFQVSRMTLRQAITFQSVDLLSTNSTKQTRSRKARNKQD